MNGVKSPRIWFYWNQEFWTPELGSSYGPSYMGINWCVADLRFETTCAYQDDVQFYQEEYSDACFTNTVGIQEKHVLDVLESITYPNPFYTSTIIEYHLDQPSDVTLSIFNHLCEQVELIQQHQTSGKQKINWNAERLLPGVYFYTLKAGEQVATGKMVLMR